MTFTKLNYSVNHLEVSQFQLISNIFQRWPSGERLTKSDSSSEGKAEIVFWFQVNSHRTFPPFIFLRVVFDFQFLEKAHKSCVNSGAYKLLRENKEYGLWTFINWSPHAKRHLGAEQLSESGHPQNQDKKCFLTSDCQKFRNIKWLCSSLTGVESVLRDWPEWNYDRSRARNHLQVLSE